jgi:hypothetical protein
LPRKLVRSQGILLLVLVAAVAYLVGRGDRPLLAGMPEGTAGANGRMIAVTGPYQQGVSLLYVLDTETKQLAVYEARGGSKSGGRLMFIGARRIENDLRLESYHDDSEYSYSDLSGYFQKSGWDPHGTKPAEAPPQKKEIR